MAIISPDEHSQINIFPLPALSPDIVVSETLKTLPLLLLRLFSIPRDPRQLTE